MYTVWQVDGKGKWHLHYAGDSSERALRIYTDLVLKHGSEHTHFMEDVPIELNLESTLYADDGICRSEAKIVSSKAGEDKEEEILNE